MKRIAMLAILVVGLFASLAAASDPFAGVTVSTTSYMAVAVVVATAIGGIWGVKKVIKLLNRS